MQGREEGRDAVSAASGQCQQSSKRAKSSLCRLFAPMRIDEVELVKNLYNSLMEAKRHCGEPTEDLSFPKFHRLIASKADGLKEKLGCDQVRFSVAIENGHVSFKARAE